MIESKNQPHAPSPSSPPNQNFDLKWVGRLLWRYSGVIAVIVSIFIAFGGATWIISNQISNVRIETTKEFQNQSSKIIDRVSENKSELSGLKSSVSHLKDEIDEVQGDIKEIRKRLNNIQVNTNNTASYEP